MRSNLSILITLIALTLFVGFASQQILNTDQLLIASISDRFTNEQIYKLINIQEKWKWLNFVVTPIFLFLKILIISSVIDIGCFLFNKEIKYSKIFKIATIAEFTFIVGTIFKTSWFYFFRENYTFEEFQYFYPLSALNIIGHEGLELWFIYPLQIFNLFEFLYWLILAYLLGKDLKITIDKGMLIVASSYGVALLVWIIGAMFLSLNIA